VPSHNHVAPKCSGITDFEKVPYMVSVHFWAISSWSHPCLHVSILFDLSKRISPPLVPKLISVLKSHTDGAFNETIRQRGLTDGCNIHGSLQCALGDREVFPPSDCPDIIFSPQSEHPSLFLVHPPPFVNLRMRFLLRERVVASHVAFSPNHFH
jgi:hypothetical protein